MQNSRPIVAPGLIAAVAALWLGAAPAAAGLMQPFTGWTEMNDCFVCDATVSFSVWQRTDLPWNQDPLFANLVATRLDGSGNADYQAPFLYLYQVVNTNHAPIPFGGEDDGVLVRFQVLNASRDRQLFTSGGYFNAVFQDGRGLVLGDDGPGSGNADGQGSGNYTLAEADFAADHYAGQGLWQQQGAQAPGTPADDIAPDYFASQQRNGGDTNPNLFNPNQGPDSAADHLPSRASVTGVTLGMVGLDRVAVPSLLDLWFDPAPPVLNSSGKVVNFGWAPDTLVTGRTSPVLFLTSWYGPVYDFGATQSQGFPGAAGDVPTAPLPGTLWLFGVGLFGLGWRARQRGQVG